MSKNKGKKNNQENQHTNDPKKEVPKNAFEARKIARKVLERKLEEAQVNAINEILVSSGYKKVEITDADYIKRGAALKKVREEAKKLNSNGVNRKIKDYEEEMAKGTMKVMDELKEGSTSAFTKWVKNINDKYIKNFANLLINSADLYAGTSIVLSSFIEKDNWVKFLANVSAVIPGGTILGKKLKELYDEANGKKTSVKSQNVDKKEEGQKQGKNQNLKVVAQTVNEMLKEMGLKEVKGEFNGDVNKYLTAFKKTMENLPKHEEKLAYQALAIAFNEGGDIVDSLKPGLKNKVARFNKKVIKPIVKTARIVTAAVVAGNVAGAAGVATVAVAGASIAPEFFGAAGKTLEIIAPKTYTATKENIKKIARLISQKKEERKKNKQNKPPKEENQIMNLQVFGEEFDGLEFA